MQKVKILLVDDRKENLFSLGSLLEGLNVEVHKAQSGADALALMVDYDFALAILDVQMPDMDGFELAELMRGAEKTQNIPIMFVTAASPASGFAFKGYELGAVDFLYKPIDPLILKSKVTVFIELEVQKMQLRLAKETAENANQLKSSFLANMSHEIRTPLGALMGFAELLEDEKLPAKERAEFIQTIKRNGQALVDLINDILDLSKVEAGHLGIEKEDVCSVHVVDEVITLLRKTAEQKGLTINLVSQGDIPNKIISDSKRVRQVLMNIIGNAIKFTDKGRIEVLLIGERLNDRQSRINFKITDTGIGIDADQAKKLFKPFMQADNSVTRRFGGTGLGLALSKKIAQLLGGDLLLEKSVPGQGSTFTVTIDAPHAESQLLSEPHLADHDKAVAAKDVKSLEGVQVLIVEDSSDNQTLMEIILLRKGAIIEFANNGVEGFKKASAKKYDVILMDIQMPVQDGYITVEKLRASKYQGPIIALTAHAMADERDKCIRIGCNDFLSKPIDQQQLVEKIFRYSR